MAGPGLKRFLSVWQAVGLLALMAPSMAANIKRPARTSPPLPNRDHRGRCLARRLYREIFRG